MQPQPCTPKRSLVTLVALWIWAAMQYASDDAFTFCSDPQSTVAKGVDVGGGALVQVQAGYLSDFAASSQESSIVCGTLCQLCKTRARKSSRIKFCDICKKDIDNTRNTFKSAGDLDTFLRVYNSGAEGDICDLHVWPHPLQCAHD